MTWLAHLFRGLVLLFMITTFVSVWRFAPPTQGWLALWDDAWIVHVVKFSLVQATLSTVLSVIMGIGLGWAAARGRFQLLRQALPLTTVTPTLLYVLALLDITQRLNLVLGTDFSLSGLTGIVLAHTLLNAPLVGLFILPSLEAIPSAYTKLKRTLHMRDGVFFTRIIMPLMKPALAQVAGLVFMLCFTSFTVIYVLGGSPANANLEVAIFAAIKYEFNLGLGAQLALVQAGLILLLLGFFALKRPYQNPSVLEKLPPTRAGTVAEALGLVVVLTPFIVLGIEALRYLTTPPMPGAWRMLVDTLGLALSTMVAATVLNTLWMSTLTGHRTLARVHEVLIHLLYLTPILIVCVGVYLTCRAWFNPFEHPWIINGILLTLFMQPFLYKLALASWEAHEAKTERLVRTLRLSPWQRFIHVDVPALAPTLAKVMGFAGLISVGDVAIISFFSNEDFQTLSLLLAQQLGSYHEAQAWPTALLLVGVALVLYGLPLALCRLYQYTRKALP